MAGNRKGMEKGNDTRSGLLWEVERILKECDELPQILLMENVPQIMDKVNIDSFKKWIYELEKLGYKNYTNILNACDYGIPQNRKRCYMISVLGDYNYKFPEKINCEKTFYDLLEKHVSQKYFLSKKMINCFTEYNGVFKRKNQFLRNFLRDKKYAYTITTRDGGRSFGNFVFDIKKENKDIGIRKLTPLECFRFMGFDDDDYYKCKNIGISDGALYKQCGNSIVVDVLYYIFKQLY